MDNKMNDGFKEINIQLEKNKESFQILNKTMKEMQEFSRVQSEYPCPSCNNLLYYDYIGESKVRLYCSECNRYVLARIR